MIQQLATKVAAKAIAHLGRKRSPYEIASFGRKISHTISRVKQGAEIADKIANTVKKATDTTQNFQTSLDH